MNDAELPLFTRPRQPVEPLTVRDEPAAVGASVETVIGSVPVLVIDCEPVTVNLQPIELVIVALTLENVVTAVPADGSVIATPHGPAAVTVKLPSEACLQVLNAIELAEPEPLVETVPPIVEEAQVKVMPLTARLVEPAVPLSEPAGLIVTAAAEEATVRHATNAMAAAMNARSFLFTISP